MPARARQKLSETILQQMKSMPTAPLVGDQPSACKGLLAFRKNQTAEALVSRLA
jgi:hypothetical protein